MQPKEQFSTFAEFTRPTWHYFLFETMLKLCRGLGNTRHSKSACVRHWKAKVSVTAKVKYECYCFNLLRCSPQCNQPAARHKALVILRSFVIGISRSMFPLTYGKFTTRPLTFMQTIIQLIRTGNKIFAKWQVICLTIFRINSESGLECAHVILRNFSELILFDEQKVFKKWVSRFKPDIVRVSMRSCCSSLNLSTYLLVSTLQTIARLHYQDTTQR